MVGQALDLLRDPVPGERLQGRDDAGMQDPPPFLEEATVRHLVGQGVLEGVRTFGEQPASEELGGLQVGQPRYRTASGSSQ